MLQVSISKYNSALVRFAITLNAIWTFDTLYFVSPPLCISESIRDLYIPVFDAMGASYPFILLLMTYITIELYARDIKPIVIIWKTFHKKFGRFVRYWSGDKSLIQTFATFFYLSFAKFLIVVVESFIQANVTSLEGNVVATVLYIDPTVIFFSQKHIPLIIISIVIIIFILLPLLILLIIFPTMCFQKFGNCLKPRWMLTLKIFADIFQGCYKNGTNGTRDYRQMAGYILSLWIITPVLVFIVKLITSNHPLALITVLCLVSMTMSVAILVLQPYQHQRANISGIFVASFIAAGSILITFFGMHTWTDLALFCIIFSTIPHCVFYGYLIYHVIKRLRRFATTLHEEEGVMHRLMDNGDDK